MNLFDVTHGWTGTGMSSDKPRSASTTEVTAYLRWLAEHRGVDVTGCTFAADGAWRGEALVLPMPGYGQQPAAIMETLDDDGQVIRSTTIALDRKGYMVLKARQVQDAYGPKPVKAKRAKVAPVVKTAEILDPVAEAPSAPIVRPETDPIAAIVARVEELEARLATLSEQSQASAILGDATVTLEGPKRTPAHERAIRRAWDQRCARIAQADLDRRALLQVNAGYRSQMEELQAVRAERDTLATSTRDALANLGKEARRADVAEKAVARIKREMADPTTPDRASDVARLLRERDEARNASAALQARAERAEKAVADLADRFEAMGTRLAIAESKARRAAA